MRLKAKLGKCIDCSTSDPDKPLTAGRCPFHYTKHRSTFWKKKEPTKELKSKIRPKSKKQDARDKKYLKIRATWIIDHPICEIQIVPECSYHACDVHHTKGKLGDLYFDTKYFKAACRFCHEYVELHPKEAKELGFSSNRLTINI